MARVPPVLPDDPDFRDDPAIPDDEGLQRGLLAIWLPKGIDGPVSSAAFKTRQHNKIRRHVSTYRDSLARPCDIWPWLQRSVALATVSAGEARGLAPEITGVCDADGHRGHARIIRHRQVSDDEWAVVAIHLAESARVTASKE